MNENLIPAETVERADDAYNDEVSDNNISGDELGQQESAAAADEEEEIVNPALESYTTILAKQQWKFAKHYFEWIMSKMLTPTAGFMPLNMSSR